MRAATGLSDTAFFNQETDEIEGQTYCQFFARQGALSTAVAVNGGGASLAAFNALWDVGIAAGVAHLPGIGDDAIYGDASHGGLAKVHGIGVSIGAGGLDGVDARSAVTKILTSVAGRV